jgi:hypothetical protein
MSMILNILLAILHGRKKIRLENLLLERNNANGKCGNGPSKWLKLKFMVWRLKYFDDKYNKIPLILLLKRF